VDHDSSQICMNTMRRNHMSTEFDIGLEFVDCDVESVFDGKELTI